MVAGIRCAEVLERLSDYVDGDLTDAEVAQVEAHLAGCSWCERFGDEFVQVLTAFRTAMANQTDVDHETARRLDERLATTVFSSN